MKIELSTLLMKPLFQESEMFSLFTSSLYDQTTLYDMFHKDISRAKKRVIIESPFIIKRRIATLFPILERLRERSIFRLIIIEEVVTAIKQDVVELQHA